MKLYSLFSTLSIFFIVFFLVSCEEKATKETPKTNSETSTKDSKDATKTSKNDTTYFAWVTNINMRDSPSTKGTIVGTYTNKEPLTFTGIRSDNRDIIVLRGVAYQENWLKVTTTDNTEGWVFGGAVKKENERKGNAIITKDRFDFTHFGNFDLTTWENIGVRNREAGDADTTTTTYLKNGQTLEIQHTEVGEYGYYHTYTLKNDKGEILKERFFNFTVDIYENERNLELSETVKDYQTNKLYERKQRVDKHFMQLNAKPVMVNGVWTTTTLLENDKTIAALNKKIAFAKPLQIISDFSALPQEVDINSGCSCSFRTHPNDYKTIVLFSNIEEAPKAKASIKVDGEYILLNSKKVANPDYKRGDYHAHYYNDTYDLKIVAFKDGEAKTEAQSYAGTMKLTLKDGTVLSNINIFGTCGC
ncbi:SH3 domain-containing protein [Kordia sp.]|uniref:SH3 domain-containing protein n=1 Tax=Kordia sp. TaxID=1965332 RepID=UPI003D267E28